MWCGCVFIIFILDFGLRIFIHCTKDTRYLIGDTRRPNTKNLHQLVKLLRRKVSKASLMTAPGKLFCVFTSLASVNFEADTQMSISRQKDCCLLKLSRPYYFVTQWRSQYGGKGDRVPPWQRKKKCQQSGKREKKSGKWGGQIRGKEEKSGRKGKNREGSFSLPLLTDRAGYATDSTILVCWKLVQ